MKGYVNHRKAVNMIASQMNIESAQVDHVLESLFKQLRRNLRFPNSVRIPHLGTLDPDMRSHKNLQKRREKFAKINLYKLRKK